MRLNKIQRDSNDRQQPFYIAAAICFLSETRHQVAYKFPIVGAKQFVKIAVG